MTSAKPGSATPRSACRREPTLSAPASAKAHVIYKPWLKTMLELWSWPTLLFILSASQGAGMLVWMHCLAYTCQQRAKVLQCAGMLVGVQLQRLSVWSASVVYGSTVAACSR